MDRRAFTGKLLTAVAGFALMDSLVTTQAFGKAIRPITDHWVNQLHEYCGDLKKGSLSPTEWQSQIDVLYNRIELEELLRFIDMDQLKSGFELPDLGVNAKPIKFPRLSGLPERTAFVKKIFGMRKDRAIIPHGHSNMASAHLVLEGEMHLRHYENLGKEDNHLIIKPTIDKVVKPGESSSISDEKDNVHWFVANSAQAFTFDVIVLDLQGKSYDIHNLDIYEQTPLGDGSSRVPILDVETALKKYGKETHH